MLSLKKVFEKVTSALIRLPLISFACSVARGVGVSRGLTLYFVGENWKR